VNAIMDGVCEYVRIWEGRQSRSVSSAGSKYESVVTNHSIP